MKTKRDNYTFLTTAPVHRVILTMAIPTIISMLVTSLYNMVDTYFVGKINTQCTAAVGVSFSMMAIIQAVGFFCGHGSGNYISQKLGAKQTEDAAIMAATGFFYSFSFGIVIAIVSHLFLDDIAVMLGSTPTILPYTRTYLGIILLGAPFMTSSFTMNNQMRFQGNALLAMVGIVTGAVLNVFLAPLLHLCLPHGHSWSRHSHADFADMQFLRALRHDLQQPKHPYSPAQLLVLTPTHEGDSSRWHAIAVASGTGKLSCHHA